MTAGLNFLVDIIRISQDTDDLSGGAMLTGTVLYQDIRARMQANEEEQLLLQQGMSTLRTFNMIVVPGTLSVRERDEIEVKAPFDHPYYGNRFRVVSVSYSDHNPRDPRNYMRLSLIRDVQAHSEQ